jgi:hypothetical protein
MRMNMVQIMYTHVCKNAKMIPTETVPGIRGGGDEREWRGEFKYDIPNTLQELL